MCEWYAQSSCSSRLTPALTAVFQPTVIDMSMVGASGVAGWLGDSHGSTPAYDPGSFFITVGLWVMLSAPPAMTTRSMPARMPAAAVWIGAMPDAQWRLCARPGMSVKPRSTAA